MGAYKHDVVVVIKMGTYIMGCLFCVGAYHPDFTVLQECLYQIVIVGMNKTIYLNSFIYRTTHESTGDICCINQNTEEVPG